MILQSLVEYYEILKDDPESSISPLGYSSKGISYALNISPQGELLNIYPLRSEVTRGNRTLEVPQTMRVPAAVTRSVNIKPNFLWDNSAYVLGISDKDEDKPDYAIDRLSSFKDHNINLLSKAECVSARAVKSFYDSYDPFIARENPVIIEHLEDLVGSGGNIVFKINGTTGYVHEDPEILAVWDREVLCSMSKDVSQCLVSGKISSISRIHPKIRGVSGAQSSGASLISFNERAYESYNKTKGQGLNSPISEETTFAYTTILNYLLSPDNPNRKFKIGDTTVVYWAASSNKAYGTFFNSLFGMPSDQSFTEESTGRDTEQDQKLSEIADKVKRGQSLDLKALPGFLDPETRFYVLGLAPNAARISVRFFYTDPFYKMVEKIAAHFADMELATWNEQYQAIHLYQIINETTSQKARDKKPSPLLAGSLFRAILNDTPYPMALFNGIMIRIRADMDDSSKNIKKINHIRAATIKAFLLRKYRHQSHNPIQEVLCMSLNEKSTNQAYLMGRLFAVLEKAQQDAAGGQLNATIKDRYFTAACATPASVFPVLLRLSNHHISKKKKKENMAM